LRASVARRTRSTLSCDIARRSISDGPRPFRCVCVRSQLARACTRRSIRTHHETHGSSAHLDRHLARAPGRAASAAGGDRRPCRLCRAERAADRLLQPVLQRGGRSDDRHSHPRRRGVARLPHGSGGSAVRAVRRAPHTALEQLRRKVEMLGTGEVVVHPAHAGFGRFLRRPA
jgi:hypothetical protein